MGNASDFTVGDALLRRLEREARLRLTADEAERMKKELEAMLAFAAKLDGLEDESEPRAASVSTETSCLRPDAVMPSSDRKSLLANAPEHTEKYFKVPRTVSARE